MRWRPSIFGDLDGLCTPSRGGCRQVIAGGGRAPHKAGFQPSRFFCPFSCSQAIATEPLNEVCNADSTV